MRITGLGKLIEFGRKHADARKSLAAWESATWEAHWRTKQEVLKDFPRAKIISTDRARFEIVHNNYRLIAQIFYDLQTVEVRFIGTHNEYDRINPQTI